MYLIHKVHNVFGWSHSSVFKQNILCSLFFCLSLNRNFLATLYWSWRVMIVWTSTAQCLLLTRYQEELILTWMWWQIIDPKLCLHLWSALSIRLCWWVLRKVYMLWMSSRIPWPTSLGWRPSSRSRSWRSLISFWWSLVSTVTKMKTSMFFLRKRLL